MTKPERADLVWRKLFVENTPLSEAACGIVSILDALASIRDRQTSKRRGLSSGRGIRTSTSIEYWKLLV